MFSPPFTPQSVSALAPSPLPCPPLTWLLLKGAGSGRSVGGDAPNEDEYSAAPEWLLEACLASTPGSSQIGGTVNRGGRGGGPFSFGELWKCWREQVERVRLTQTNYKKEFLCVTIMVSKVPLTDIWEEIFNNTQKTPVFWKIM